MKQMRRYVAHKLSFHAQGQGGTVRSKVKCFKSCLVYILFTTEAFVDTLVSVIRLSGRPAGIIIRCQHFQTFSPLKLLSQLNFICSPRANGEREYIFGPGPMIKMATMPKYFLQN